ncbi:MAG: DUF1365 domain-containing protein [Hyphomonadaceae bacterium]|jgi:hypothetical protein|nr:DUF1365 domain-containing protein [Hyphomonadaceae bacterium]
MNAIYTGHVAHVRPGKHRLRYSVFMLTVDLNTPPEGLNLLKHNRNALFALFDRDHAGRKDAPLKPQIEAKLREAGIAWDGGRIVLLTMPRLFNYVFNPLSVYFCYRRDGSVAALVHEVSNTFGESHFYVLPPRVQENGAITQACAKEFFVSPFLEGGLTYEFTVTPPDERVAVAMTVRRGEEIALTASFAGARRELTDAQLFRVWMGNPLMTLKVIAGIHWEALLMWLKGVRFLGRRGQLPRQPVREKKAAA